MKPLACHQTDGENASPVVVRVHCISGAHTITLINCEEPPRLAASHYCNQQSETHHKHDARQERRGNQPSKQRSRHTEERCAINSRRGTPIMERSRKSNEDTPNCCCDNSQCINKLHSIKKNREQRNTSTHWAYARARICAESEEFHTAEPHTHS
jgi:hypothetical protein